MEKKLRSGELSPALESHYAKYRKLVPTLALVNYLADGGRSKVDLSALKKAIAPHREKRYLNYVATGWSSGRTTMTLKASNVLCVRFSLFLEDTFRLKFLKLASAIRTDFCTGDLQLGKGCKLPKIGHCLIINTFTTPQR